MNVTKNTKWADFAPFATAERVAQLRKKITDCAIFDFWSLTVGEFSEMTSSGYPKKLEDKMKEAALTVKEAIQIINACDKFLSDFYNKIKAFEIQLKPEEQQASSVMPEFTAYENMLIFTQSYFGLKDFGSAENISILEYYIARKKSYADAVYQRELSRIQEQKMKRK